MTFQFLSAMVIMVGMSLVAAETTPFPTCDNLKKYGPISWVYWYNSTVSAYQRSVKSLKSGESVDDWFPTNWNRVEQWERYPSFLKVIILDDTGAHRGKDLVVDVETGKPVDDLVPTLENDHINDYLSLVTVHNDDHTLIAYHQREGRVVAINTTTQERLRNETGINADRVPSYPSLVVIGGKYCLIGGNWTKKLPSLCYNRSQRKWTVNEQLQINGTVYTSIAHNTSLYICRGYYYKCSVYDIKIEGMASRSNLFIMDNSVFLFDSVQGTLLSIDPIGNCTSVFTYDPYAAYWENTDVNNMQIFNLCSNYIIPDVPEQSEAPEKVTKPNLEVPEKVTESKLDVHLHANSVEEKGHVKQLRFLYHQNSVQFDIIPAHGSTNQMTLMLNIDRYMPVIFGGELDRASEYVMDQITVDLKKDSVLWGMLQSSGLAKWNVEIRIQYSCSKCLKNMYAVIVVLVDVDKRSKDAGLRIKITGTKAFLAPDALIPADRERYLFFLTPVDPSMQRMLKDNKQTAWFVMNQRLTISEKDRRMV